MFPPKIFSTTTGPHDPGRGKSDWLSPEPPGKDVGVPESNGQQTLNSNYIQFTWKEKTELKIFESVLPVDYGPHSHIEIVVEVHDLHNLDLVNLQLDYTMADIVGVKCSYHSTCLEFGMGSLWTKTRFTLDITSIQLI